MSDAALQGHDVVVVGSGAAGGMAAHTLAQRGVRVLLLESGRDYNPETETPMWDHFEDAPLNGAQTPDKEQGFFDATVNGGNNVPGEPYTVAEGSKFRWWRARMLGGKTNHWGRLSLRFGPYDFKGYSRDGLGVDWPIDYEEMAPWYDRTEALVGLFGAAEGIENSPDSPDGVLQPPPPMRGYERLLKLVLGRKFGVPVVPAHMAILTQPLDDRQACFYATDCQRGCSIKANFQSPTVLISPAVASGKLAVRTDAHVIEVIKGDDGQAKGVRFIDTKTDEVHEVRTRAVVLAASTLSTTQILLNSDKGQGIANGSGQVGRNLMDTVNVGMAARIPALEGLEPWNDEGVSLYHAYAPWWGYDDMRAGKLDFARGYHLEFWGGRLAPDVGTGMGLASDTGAFGADLLPAMRERYSSTVFISGRGEMLPNDRSYMDLDPDVRDRFGMPVPRFHFAHGEQEKATGRHIYASLRDFFEGLGAEVPPDDGRPIEDRIRVGGSVIHEVGTARMGDDPAASVLDRWGAAWEMPNLYVTDGAAFASSPDKNPTLTIMALAMRSAEHLADRLGSGDF
ncbi:MAG: GMC family oxidoreductase [Erythrobacter sp.]|uniref:GMC family oxidoreductase n=1 Tax=Erythrobacter sp. TaxID=1042 RepID=UPI0026091AD0|nr:GMC family oxidoreductase [Erythrobacter sp.]MDJ0978164.1 GMC family oxidoreductase [Erythrobacter sp.]